MSNSHSLREYLQQIDQLTKGKSIESVVLNHGQEFSPPQVARPGGIIKGKDKECFTNAYHLAIEHNFTYVEGFALSIIPVHHAWVINDDLQVIETTWLEPGLAYFGIELDFDFIHKVMLETKTYGTLTMRSPSFRERYIKSLAIANNLKKGE